MRLSQAGTSLVQRGLPGTKERFGDSECSHNHRNAGSKEQQISTLSILSLLIIALPVPHNASKSQNAPVTTETPVRSGSKCCSRSHLMESPEIHPGSSAPPGPSLLRFISTSSSFSSNIHVGYSKHALLPDDSISLGTLASCWPRHQSYRLLLTCSIQESGLKLYGALVRYTPCLV